VAGLNKTRNTSIGKQTSEMKFGKERSFSKDKDTLKFGKASTDTSVSSGGEGIRLDPNMTVIKKDELEDLK
jgi:hypothetical protein